MKINGSSHTALETMEVSSLLSSSLFPCGLFLFCPVLLECQGNAEEVGTLVLFTVCHIRPHGDLYNITRTLTRDMKITPQLVPGVQSSALGFVLHVLLALPTSPSMLPKATGGPTNASGGPSLP